MLESKVDCRLGGIAQNYVAEKNERPMLIDPQFKKSVVFIGCKTQNANGINEEYYGGTGFFLSVPISAGKGRITYLVTAKHNIDGIKEMQEGIKDQNSIIRINKYDGTAQTFDIPLSHWKFHPTEEEYVDVAVVRIVNLSQKIFDYLSIPTEWSVSQDLKVRVGEETQRLSEGEDTFVIGLFKYHYGNKQNYPIIRAGNIALLPQEKVSINKKIGEADMYLVENRSIKGLSGSPIFVSLGIYYIKDNASVDHRPVGTTVFHWLGLVSGHFLTDESDIDFVDRRKSENGKLNVGISFIVPAYKVIEVLNSKELLEERKRIEEVLKAKQSQNKSLDYFKNKIKKSNQ